jgi:putative transposase
VSNRQRHVQAKRREVLRKLAATRTRSHGHLAHQVLALGNTIQLEHLSYRAWQRRYGRSVNRCAPGRLVARVSRLAASAGGAIVAISPRRAKLSQTCACGRVAPKRLSQRWHVCPDCGASAQRDPMSAFLAQWVDPDTSLLEAGQAHAAWPAGEPLLQAAFEQAIHNEPASGRRLPSSFGRPPGVQRAGPSQSESPASGAPTQAQGRDALARRQRVVRARQRRR